jgi:hypothetical protein
MPFHHDPGLPVEGLDALGAYVERGMSRLDDLQPAAQLRLRAAMTLHTRLRMCIEEKWALDAGLFSPADILTLNEIAAETPHDRQSITNLAHAIEEQVSKSSR